VQNRLNRDICNFVLSTTSLSPKMLEVPVDLECDIVREVDLIRCVGGDKISVDIEYSLCDLV